MDLQHMGSLIEQGLFAGISLGLLGGKT
jgi:hypothetical protein